MITFQGASRYYTVTARIRCGTFVGTGFFFKFDNSKSCQTLITCAHVISQAEDLEIYVHQNTGSTLNLRQFTKLKVPQFRQYALIDAHNDLCLIDADVIAHLAKANGVLVRWKHLHEGTVLPQDALEELTAVEPVLMMGYPAGIIDVAHNLPLFRRGFTASHPAIPFCGDERGVIDIAAFPGSSGSPIFHLADNSPDHARLLGILTSGPRDPNNKETLHLGYYNHSKTILDLKPAYLSQMRRWRSKMLGSSGTRRMAKDE